MEPIFKKHYIPDPTEGGGNPTAKSTVKAPEGFTPLSVSQRGEWNNFLDYVEKSGLAASPKLDVKDQSLGLNLMNQYKKQNPNFSITPQMIPNIQYDQYLLRKGESYPTLQPQQLAYVRNGLNPAYMAKETSPIDGWLGSITSRLYYPTAERADNHGNKYKFGNDIEAYVNSLKDPSIQQKYLVR